MKISENILYSRYFTVGNIITNCIAICLAALLLLDTAKINAQDDDDVLNLDAFVVQSDLLTTYRAPDTISATGINVPILDVPLTISVLTEGRIVDNNAFEMHQILDTIPTVQTSIRNESSFNLRGFSALTLYRNGHYRRQLFPTWNVDRVEVIKGPSAIYHGQARPGGVINYITRRPSSVRSTSIRTSMGTGADANSQWRAEITHTGALNDFISYRVGAGHWEGGDWHLDWRNRENYVGGSFEIKPSDRLTILLDFEHIDRNRSDGETLTQSFDTVNGLRTHLPDSFFGGPSRRYEFNVGGSESFRDYRSWTAEAEISYQILDWLLFRQTINYSVDDFEVLRTFITPVRPNNNSNIASLHVGHFANWRDNFSYDTALIAQYKGDIFSNTFQVGLDIQSVHNTTPGFGRRNGRRGPVFRYNMATGEFPDFPNKEAEYPLAVQTYVNEIEGLTRHGQWNDLRRRVEKDNGFYFLNMTDLMDERLRVIWGMRYVETSREQHFDSQPPEERGEINFENDGWVPQIGFNFDLTEGLTFYSVYSESVERNNREDALGVTGEPIESFGYDVGFKFELQDTGLAGTVNYWLLNRGNQTERDFDREAREMLSPFFFFGLEQETSGFEIDLSYMPMPNWQMTFGYSYFLKHETVASTQNPQNIGQEFAVVPQQFSFWNRYNFTDSVVEGLSIGGGVKWLDDREDPRWVNGVSNPSLLTVDIFAKYQIPGTGEKYRHTVGININNLFDNYEVFSTAQAPRIFFVNYSLDF